ncbi:Hypothetical protein MCYN_0076 [Mycoplasmopsis cynos C142]|uniref:Uncharacterized protein n=1 Tax=Mycoplasmopsis cynos (strain C142) TaxID=1246955 RepID=L0RU70_MYCC1|nr:Hypothetical protein MCYN_0076 [Mycoplasmopsis cynos C142]
MFPAIDPPEYINTNIQIGGIPKVPPNLTNIYNEIKDEVAGINCNIITMVNECLEPVNLNLE